MLRLFIMLSMAVVVVACNSFNGLQITGTTTTMLVRQEFGEAPSLTGNALPAEGKPRVIESTVYKVPEGMCPEFKAPRLPPSPEVPYEELKQLSRSDLEGLDRLTGKHIEDLHSYIARSRDILESAMVKYRETCANYRTSQN